MTGVSSPRGFRCRLKLIFDPGLDQAAGVRREDVAVLAERVFVEEQPDRIVFRILDEVGREVVHDLEASRIGRFALDRHHVHVFREARIDQHVDDVVGPICRQHVRLLHRDDEIGLADVPLVEIAELARRAACRPDCPCGAPASTQLAMVAISASVSEDRP